MSVPHQRAKGIHDTTIKDLEDRLRFNYIEDAEPPERYRPGGYHPLSLGDVIHHQYRIVHKLGFGSFSTTWLAKDVAHHDRYVAIKITTADSSAMSKEARTLRKMAADVHSNNEQPNALLAAGKAIIPSILDEFTISGPNGVHQCIVTPPARMTVAEAQDASYTRLFQPRVARAIAAQLIQAVAFIHMRGFVHAGTLNISLCRIEVLSGYLDRSAPR